jgi:integrase
MRKLPSAREVARYTGQGRYAVGHGAYLQISEWGTKAWIFRYRRDGKQRHIGMGSVTYVSLNEARDRAFQYQRDLARGIDPLTAKRAAAGELAAAAKPRPTFRKVAEEYIAAHEATWRGDASRRQWLGSLSKHAYPKIDNMPIADVDTAAVLSVLDGMTDVRETAARVQRRIAAILDWAAVRGYRSPINPAKQKLMPPQRAKAKHFAALDYRAVPGFLAELCKRNDVAAKPLQLQILTATRPGEALGARWSEFDGDTWIVPGERTKTNEPLRIPLSRQALALLSSLPREAGTDLVFTGRWAGVPVSDKGLGELVRAMGYDATAHGMRASFRTWAEEQTSFAHAVVEAALGHKIPSAVERAYQRSDLIERRRQLMQQWADYLSTPAHAGEVVPMRGVS